VWGAVGCGGAGDAGDGVVFDGGRVLCGCGPRRKGVRARRVLQGRVLRTETPKSASEEGRNRRKKAGSKE